MAEAHRVFYISAPENLNTAEFAEHLSRRIRKSNAEFPDSQYIIGDLPADILTYEFLRRCGVSPDRITIFHRGPPHNPYRCKTHYIPDDIKRRQALVKLSTHDITWNNPNTKIQRRSNTKPKTIHPFQSIYVPK